jgi:hypothetical protein
VVALAVHQAIDAALEPLAQWLEQHGNQARGDERD